MKPTDVASTLSHPAQGSSPPDLDLLWPDLDPPSPDLDPPSPEKDRPPALDLQTHTHTSLKHFSYRVSLKFLATKSPDDESYKIITISNKAKSYITI